MFVIAEGRRSGGIKEARWRAEERGGGRQHKGKSRSLTWPPCAAGSGMTIDNAELALEQVPEELVVDFVVELDFLGFDDGAESTRAAVGGGALQFGVAGFDVGAEKRG